MASVNVKREYPNICRICLDDDPEDRHTIFDELPDDVTIDSIQGGKHEQFSRIHEFLMSFTNIKAEQDDGLPSNICGHCLYLTQTAFNLYKLCNESQKYFDKIKIDIGEEEIIISIEDNESEENLIAISDDGAVSTFTDPLSSDNFSKLSKIVGEEILECPTCKKIFTTSDQLMLHYESHRNQYALCITCEETFPSQKVYEEHCALLHPVPNENKKTIALHPISSDKSVTQLVTDPTIKRNVDYKGKFTVLVKYGNTTMYRCNTCNLEVESNTFKQHYDTHISPFYKCAHCNTLFHQRQSYIRHLWSDHPQSGYLEPLKREVVVVNLTTPLQDAVKKKAFVPKILKKGTPRKILPKTTDLQKTMVELVTNPNVIRKFNYAGTFIEKPGADGKKVYECKKCKKEIASKFYNFKVHYDTHIHPFYICEHCNKTFYRGRDLKYHLESNHPESQYVTRAQTIMEAKTKEVEMTPKTCILSADPNVQRSINYTGTYIEKFSSNSSKTEFECTTCHKTFLFLNNFTYHYYEHLDPFYACVPCNETFHRSTQLRKHLQEKHPQSPYLKTVDKPPAESPRLNKTILNLQTNPNVQRIYDFTGTFVIEKQVNNSQKYKCLKCDKKFVDLSSFKIHYFVHLDPFYFCLHCKSMFHRQITYKNHLKLHHPQSKYNKNMDIDKSEEPNVATVEMYVKKNKSGSFKIDHFTETSQTYVDEMEVSENVEGDETETVKIEEIMIDEVEGSDNVNMDEVEEIIIDEVAPSGNVATDEGEIVKVEEITIDETEASDNVDGEEANIANLETNPNVQRSFNYEGKYILQWQKNKKMYQCTKCENALSSKDYFKIHYDKHLDPFYICEHCNATFHRQAAFRKHLEENHPELPYINKGESVKIPVKMTTKNREYNYAGKYIKKLSGDCVTNVYECLTCGKNIRNSLQAFKNHYESHLDPFYKCEYCKKKFRRGQMYREHMLTHVAATKKKRRVVPKAEEVVSDKKPGELETNPNVKRNFDFSDKYIIKVNEDEEKVFECVECKKTISSNFSFFQRHYETHLDAFYICPICRVTFVNQHRFKVHLKKVHTTERHCCDTCGKMYKTDKGLSDHMMTHQGIRPYKCDECNKRFVRKNDLFTHKKIHSNFRPYICIYCGYASKTNSQLHTHMRRIHTKEKPHACTQCDKAFLSKVQLNLHIAWHSGDRRFKCDLCDKRFLRRSRLTEHLLIHAGRRFHCTYCNNQFTMKQALGVHLRICPVKREKEGFC